MIVLKKLSFIHRQSILIITMNLNAWKCTRLFTVKIKVRIPKDLRDLTLPSYERVNSYQSASFFWYLIELITFYKIFSKEEYYNQEKNYL